MAETHRTYQTASNNFEDDIQKAGDDDRLIGLVNSNLQTAQANYSRAMLEHLASTSLLAEAAYEAARSANKSIDQARKRAGSIVALVKLTAAANTAVAHLITAASS